MYKSSKFGIAKTFLVGATLSAPAFGAAGTASIKSDFWSCGLSGVNDQLTHLGITYNRAWVFDYTEITDNFYPQDSKVVFGWKLEMAGSALPRLVRLQTTQEILPEYFENSELGYFEYIDVLFDLKGYSGRAMNHEDINGLVDVAFEEVLPETYPDGDSKYTWTWNIKGEIPGYDQGTLKLVSDREFANQTKGFLTLSNNENVRTIPVKLNCSYTKN